MKDAATLVGTGGTITTIAAVEIGLAEYDRDALHRFVLTRAAAEDVFRTLATERLADRVHNPGLPRIGPTSSSAVAACSSQSCAASSFKECVVSEPICSTASPTSSRLRLCRPLRFAAAT